MKILEPADIKNQRNESAEQANKRTRDLAVEEARLARTISLVRDNAEKQIKEINESLEEFKKEQKQEKNRLTVEITKLEERRKDALKPINELRQEAESILANANLILDEAEKGKQEISDIKEKLQDDRENLKDREDDLNERETKIKIAEQVIAGEKTRQENSAQTLSGKWVEYDKAVAELNFKISNFEDREVQFIINSDNTKKILYSRQLEQDKREVEQNKKDTALNDKFKTLERTQQRLKDQNG